CAGGLQALAARRDGRRARAPRATAGQGQEEGPLAPGLGVTESRLRADLPASTGAETGVLRRVLFWLPVIAYTALIWWLSSQAIEIPLQRVPFRDKGVHFVEYGVLAFMMAHAVRVTWPAARYGLVAAWWLTVALGLTD